MNGGWPTTGDVLRRAAQLWPTRSAAVDGSDRRSYEELLRRVSQRATCLRRSLAPGTRVAYLGENSLPLLEAYFAVPEAGMTFLPLNWRLAQSELRQQLEAAQVGLLIAGPGYEAAATAAGDGLPCDVISPDELTEGWSASATTGLHLVADTPASHRGGSFLYCTSGSTGDPKQIGLTNENVLSGSLASAAALGLGDRPVWLHAGPMFHLADAWSIWAVTWHGGLHVLARFDPESAVALIERERVSHTLLVPTALNMLAHAASNSRTRLPTLRVVLYGGASLPALAFEQARKALAADLVGTYGATEASGIITVLHEADALDLGDGARATCVGRETPIFSVELVDHDGRPVTAGDPGEVLLRSPALASGWLDDRGRFHTGDVARRDSGGRLHLVGRSKEMLISGGENIYPAEVERTLEQHPAVAEVAVAGRPDAKWGEIVAAVVVWRPGQSATLGELRDFARSQLAGYKLPRALASIDELPHTPSGKVDKRALAKRGDALPWEVAS